jgi:SulP family sulfate permease
MSAAPPAWLWGYSRSWLTRDLVAGLTLWALVVPEAMAYASIAGVPPQFGLYSVPLAVLAYAWLGSSQRLFVGPSSTLAALTATVVAPLATAATDRYVVLTVYVAVGQLPKLVGMHKPEGNSAQQLWGVASSWGSWNTATVVVGVGSLVALVEPYPTVAAAVAQSGTG